MTQLSPPGGKPVDLRSDTVTRPSPAMYRAMMDAPVGDDVLGDDPTVIALQERVAALLAKEAALFTPSGTMANQIALKVHTRPGDAIICEEGCHVLNYEGGAPAAISGIVARTIPGKCGAFTADQVRERILPPDSHYPIARVVEIENTHNRAGGAIFPQPAILEIAALCRERDIALHLDGARLWNAHVATGIALDTLAEPADTVSVCFSKGLGCPVGSVLAGSRDHIAYAHRIRKYLGGGMRQSGILAGAALYALDNNIERLADDHDNARLLAAAFAEFQHVTPIPPATNILIVEFDRAHYDVTQICQALEARGVKCLSISPMRLRFVLHLDVSREQTVYACDVVKDVLSGS